MIEQPSTTLGTQAGREGITIDHRSNHPTETCPSCQDALTFAGYALVPVKEALTIERIESALWDAQRTPDSVTESAEGLRQKYGDERATEAIHAAEGHLAAALLAALKGDSE